MRHVFQLALCLLATATATAQDSPTDSSPAPRPTEPGNGVDNGANANETPADHSGIWRLYGVRTTGENATVVRTRNLLQIVQLGPTLNATFLAAEPDGPNRPGQVFLRAHSRRAGGFFGAIHLRGEEGERRIGRLELEVDEHGRMVGVYGYKRIDPALRLVLIRESQVTSVKFFVAGRSGVRQVEELYSGLPAFGEIHFARPLDEATIRVQFRARDTVLTLAADRANETGTVFRTEQFLPWPSHIPPPSVVGTGLIGDGE